MLTRRRRLRVEALEARYLLTGDTWEGRVSMGADDAEQRTSGVVILPSSDLELTRDLSDTQTVGLRFADVDIPPGATIQAAYLQFQADEKGLDSASFTIHGQAARDAPVFRAKFGNISNRATTDASVEWSPPPWLTVGQAGPDQRTPDIGELVREIVNRADWTSGNALAFIFTGNGQRVVESYEGDPDGAPLLHIQYVANGLPIASDDLFHTDEDTPLTGNVLAPNPAVPDGDPDGDPLIVAAVNGHSADVGKQIRLASGALLTLHQSGQFTYDPNDQFDSQRKGQTTTDTFTYQIDDGKTAGTDTATATVRVSGINDAPSIAVNTGGTVFEGSIETITSAMLNEGDPDDGGRGLTYTLTQPPVNGILRLNGGAFGLNGTFSQDDIDNQRVRYDHNGSQHLFDSFGFRLFDGGEDGAAPATGTFDIAIVQVIERPTLTTFASPVKTTHEDTAVAITLSELKARGNETDADGVVDAFVVKSVASGTLKIGGTAATATAWSVGSNDTIDANSHAFWAPAPNAVGMQDAFAVVAVNDAGAQSIGNVTVPIMVHSVQDLPTLTRFAGVVEHTAEDTEIEVTVAELRAQGDQSDVDGVVNAFGVKSVPTGTLRIGTSAATARPWVAGINDTIDIRNHAYWTPALNVTGTQNALGVVAINNFGAASIGTVIAQISVSSVDDLPILTRFAGVIDRTSEDTEVELTLAELKAQGDEADADGIVNAFGVKLVRSGSLRIGSSAVSAAPWSAGINDTIDAANHAYWTPALNAIGTQNAFGVVAINDSGGESIGAVTAQVLVTSVNLIPPTLTRFVDVIDATSPQTEVELTLAELKAQGDEADADGVVRAFRVTSVTTGTLRIGGNAATATAWAVGTNDILDATHHAYWTPASTAVGTHSVFEVVAQDDLGLESIHGVLAQVLVTALEDDPLPTCGVPGNVCFAVIGDWGQDGQELLDVSNLVKSWSPDLIITTGDNNYPDGEASTIDENVGKYYHEFIHPYQGSFGVGADVNRFFPSLGNHDWHTRDVQPHHDYFTLPGNERYYDFTWGPVHFFAIDSNREQPDGFTSTSVQARWLQNQLAASTAPWKIVYMHHPPYSSAKHGSSEERQWPFQEWGASAVLTGHDHTYERIVLDDFPYFVNGLGGRRAIYNFETPIEGSEVRYNSDYGAMRVRANDSRIIYEFISRTGTVVDSFIVADTGPLPIVTVAATDTTVSEAGASTGKLAFVRSGDLGSPLNVNYTVTGKAINGSDFIALDGVAVIPAGVSSVVIEVIPIDDGLVEGSERLTVGISTSANYNVGTANHATIAIVDDDVGVVEVVETRVATGFDDSEQRFDGTISLGSSDLELTTERGDSQIVGMRFTGVNVPPDAIILNAYVQFQADEKDTDPTTLVIRGQAVDDAEPLTATIGDLSNRPTTSASVIWNPAPWLNVGQAGPDERTSDISDIIQETVNRAGWSSGNSLAIIVSGTGKRTAESYDGNQHAAPLLHVEYALAAATTASSVLPPTAPSSVGRGNDSVLVLDLNRSLNPVALVARLREAAFTGVVEMYTAVEHQLLPRPKDGKSNDAAMAEVPDVAASPPPADGDVRRQGVSHPVDQLLVDKVLRHFT